MGVLPESLLDFSSNTSPLSLPKELSNLLADNLHQVRRLPEVDSIGVRLALAQRFSMDARQFLISGGTTHWIYALPRVLRPHRVIVPLPTYSDYVDAARQANVPVTVISGWRDGAPLPMERVIQAAAEEAAPGDMIFICNPNNPTGTFCTPGLIAETARNCPEALWIIDESYAPFVADDEQSSMLSRQIPSNCLILRSFSKIYGIPGLRLGYAAGAAKLVEKLECCQEPWQVNRLAQIAGEWLAANDEFESAVRRFCQEEKEYILGSLSSVTVLEYMGGETHFMLFRLCGGMGVDNFCSRLLKEKILIRDCSNFHGLDGGSYIRISPGSSDENRCLITALKGMRI